MAIRKNIYIDEKEYEVLQSIKKEYGLKNITYPFFDDNATTIKSFVLRNSGEETNRIRIKDTLLSEVLKGLMEKDLQIMLH